MYYVPWIGQQTMLTDVLGSKPINPLVFVVVGVVNVVLAVVVVRATADCSTARRSSSEGNVSREDHEVH